MTKAIKNDVLFFRVDEEQRAAIQRAAERAGEEHVSAWLRKVVMNAVHDQMQTFKRKGKKL